MMNSQVSVRYNRRIAALAGALAVVATALCARRAITASSAGELAVLVCAVVGFGALCVFYLRRVVTRRAALVIDDDGVTVARRGQSVLWEEIGELYLRSRQGLFNEYHHLVIGHRSSQPDLTQPIDQLEMSWKDIVELVEDRSGRRVHVRRQRGLRSGEEPA